MLFLSLLHQPKVATTLAVLGTPAQINSRTSHNRKAALAADPRIEIDADRLSGSINLQGARIDDLKLKDYHEIIDKTSPTIVLLSPKSAAGEAYFAEFGWVGNKDSGGVPQSNTKWEIKSRAKLTSDSPVKLIWENDKGVKFFRTISIDSDYMFTIEDSVQNNSSVRISLQPYGRIARFGKPKTEGLFILHEGLIGDIGEEGLIEVDYDDIEEDLVKYMLPATTGWLGITDKYWATALIPSGKFTSRFAFFSKYRKQYQADYIGDAISVGPGKSAKNVSRPFCWRQSVCYS